MFSKNRSHNSKISSSIYFPSSSLYSPKSTTSISSVIGPTIVTASAVSSTKNNNLKISHQRPSSYSPKRSSLLVENETKNQQNAKEEKENKNFDKFWASKYLRERKQQIKENEEANTSQQSFNNENKKKKEEIKDDTFKQRLLTAHKTVDELLQRRGLSSRNDLQKERELLLRQYEKLLADVVKEEKEEKRQRNESLSSSDSGLSEDYSEREKRPEINEMEREEENGVDEVEENNQKNGELVDNKEDNWEIKSLSPIAPLVEEEKVEEEIEESEEKIIKLNKRKNSLNSHQQTLLPSLNKREVRELLQSTQINFSRKSSGKGRKPCKVEAKLPSIMRAEELLEKLEILVKKRGKEENEKKEKREDEKEEKEEGKKVMGREQEIIEKSKKKKEDFDFEEKIEQNCSDFTQNNPSTSTRTNSSNFEALWSKLTLNLNEKQKEDLDKRLINYYFGNRRPPVPEWLFRPVYCTKCCYCIHRLIPKTNKSWPLFLQLLTPKEKERENWRHGIECMEDMQELLRAKKILLKQMSSSFEEGEREEKNRGRGRRLIEIEGEDESNLKWRTKSSTKLSHYMDYNILIEEDQIQKIKKEISEEEIEEEVEEGQDEVSIAAQEVSKQEEAPPPASPLKSPPASPLKSPKSDKPESIQAEEYEEEEGDEPPLSPSKEVRRSSVSTDVTGPQAQLRKTEIKQKEPEEKEMTEAEAAMLAAKKRHEEEEEAKMRDNDERRRQEMVAVDKELQELKRTSNSTKS
ncbi:hypothetical protein Mgra_00009715 [Meloidogyne graminicola]|uniref:Uncharacterized protein n=1 Tax=Meloidogyne graminicola TaxID=189291 RepID=A0A8S9ZBK9_9BILA|nr:hypothetical protein Mgra_00009715 [Meloidogyne graminicola]